MMSAVPRLRLLQENIKKLSVETELREKNYHMKSWHMIQTYLTRTFIYLFTSMIHSAYLFVGLPAAIQVCPDESLPVTEKLLQLCAQAQSNAWLQQTANSSR